MITMSSRNLASTVRALSLTAGCAALLMAAAAPGHAQLTAVSSGYSLPETLSQAPATFGAYGGNYFVTDPTGGSGTPEIETFSAAVPTPAVFVSPDTDTALPSEGYFANAGLFLPNDPAAYGALAGDYVTAGNVGQLATDPSEVVAYDAGGGPTVLATTANDGSYFYGAALAPASFGAYGGDLFLTNEAPTETTGALLSLSLAGGTAGGLAPLVGAGGLAGIAAGGGLTFLPSGFGAFGGDLLVDDIFSGRIDAVNAAGNVTPFADLSLLSGQTGLRQMAVSPAGFLPGAGPLLFVSVSGSTADGGAGGNILVLNAVGQVVSRLDDTGGLPAFDPRGLLFTDYNGVNGLLVSDAADPIRLATAHDFTPLPTVPTPGGPAAVPEPSSCALLGLGLLPLGGILRLRARRRTI